MPALFKMSDEKQTIDSPTVVIAESSPSAQPRKTKKYVIIAVSAILSVAIILTAILVGMHIFSEAQKEIIKYTLTLNNAKQDVTSDPNENIVQYHISNPGQETWIVNDFNKDIQVVKVRSESETNCYVSALNRTSSMDPSQISKPQSSDIKGASTLVYVTSGTPISDTSFLSKTASGLCKGVSIYWVYPKCMDKDNAQQYTNTTDMTPRSKRYVDGSPNYYIWYPPEPPGGPAGTVCVAGCCKYLCACKLKYYWVVEKGIIYCTWYVYDCNGNASTYVPQYGCINRPTGITCPSKAPAAWPTC